MDSYLLQLSFPFHTNYTISYITNSISFPKHIIEIEMKSYKQVFREEHTEPYFQIKFEFKAIQCLSCDQLKCFSSFHSYLEMFSTFYWTKEKINRNSVDFNIYSEELKLIKILTKNRKNSKYMWTWSQNKYSLVKVKNSENYNICWMSYRLNDWTNIKKGKHLVGK